MVTLFYQTAIDHVYFYEIEFAKLIIRYPIERLNREIKRRTKAIGAFPDGQSALMLVCARLRHVAGTQWGTRRYMNMEHLSKLEDDLLSDIIAG